MKKILFLMLFSITAINFSNAADSIVITAPSSVGANLAGTPSSSPSVFTITYSLKSNSTVYIEAKRGTSLVGNINFTPTVIDGTLTTTTFAIPNASSSIMAGDAITMQAAQFPGVDVYSNTLSFTIQAALVPYITMTPPATADLLLYGATAFTAKYYSTSSKPIYIDGKRGGVNGNSYGSWTINSPVVGVETTITLAQLNSWNPNSITLAVGDKLILRADQYGGTGPIPTTTSAEFTIVSGSLGTNSFEKSTIAAYPNPVVDVLTLAGDSDAKSYKVVDITGKTVLQNIPAAKSIDLSALKTGQYFLISDKNSALRLMKL
jgi:Secretion system C-terminal sorting domain